VDRSLSEATTCCGKTMALYRYKKNTTSKKEEQGSEEKRGKASILLSEDVHRRIKSEE